MNPFFMFESQNDAKQGGGSTARQSVEGIARKTKVPANVLIALAETGGAKTADEALAIAEQAAAELGPRIQAGEDIKSLIRETAGDKADAFMTRAREIGETLYPKQMAKLKAAQPPKEGGLGAAVGVGIDQLQQATGSAIEGVGRSTGLDGLAEYGAGVADRNRQEIEDASAGMTRLEDVDGVGSGAKFVGETLAQQVPQLGVSLGAAATGAAIGTAVLPGLGTAAGAVGGMIGGTLANLPFFYGMNRERQKEAHPAEGVDELKAIVASAPQAALDTFGDMLIGGLALKPAAKGLTGIFTRAVPREVAEKAGMKILGRAAGGAAMGGMVEVPTEIGQSVIERAQAGLPLWDEDARREYLEVGVAAGIVGGTVGGVAGAMGRHEPEVNVEEPPRPEAEQQTLALPAPEAGGTIFGAGPTRDPAAFERQPGDYRAGDPTQQPAQFRPGGTLRTALNAGMAAQAPAPANPSAPAAPAPAPTPAMRAAANLSPGEILPGVQPGAAVRVWTPDGNPIGGTMTAQSPMAVTVTTSDGEVLEIPRSEFDAGQVSVSLAPTPEPGPEPERPATIREGEQPVIKTGKAKPEDPPAAAAPEPQPQGPAPAEPPARATGDFSDLTPDEARKRIAIIEDQARARGWDARLRGIHDQLKAVADADMLAENAAAQEASKIRPAVIAKKDGSPFKSEAQARRAVENQGRDPAAYRIEPKDGGFVAVPTADQAGTIQEEAAGETATAPATGPVGPKADGAAVLPDGARVGEVPAQDRGAVEEGRAQDQAVPEEASPASAGIAADDAPAGDMDGAVGSAEPAPALTGTAEAQALPPATPPSALPATSQAEADEDDRQKRVREFEESKVRADEARKNLVVNKTLPGRQKHGVPMAEIQVGKAADGTFQVRSSMQTPTGGFGHPMDGTFASAEQAEASAREHMIDRAKAVLSPDANGYNDQDRADAKKILTWLGVPLEERNGRGMETDVTTPAAPQTPTVTDIRERAAVLRGVPKDAPPAVPGVSLKWDERERGFIFSRKHRPAVEQAVGLAQATPAAAEKAPAESVPVADARQEEKKRKAREAGAAAARDGEPRKAPAWLGEDLGNEWLAGYAETSTKAPAESWRENRGLALFKRVMGQPDNSLEDMRTGIFPDVAEYADWLGSLSDADLDKIAPAFRDEYNPFHGATFLGNGGIADAEAAFARVGVVRGGKPAVPTREEIDAAAAETDPNPTEGQKEAENYRTGKAPWNGLTLSIENAKGSIRSKTTPDGKTAWSVKMPAHYGRILRTEGADGDHVDFYMGDMPDSDFVLIVNQVDAETGKWDEHKVILGTGSTSAALGIYEAGFSDGKGRQRIGSFTATSVEGFKNWLASGDLTKPTEPVKKRGAAPNPAPEAEPGPEAATTPADVADAVPVAAEPEKPKPAPKKLGTAAKSAASKPKGLKGLTEAENAELAALEAEFLAMLKNQVNSGLDPQMVAVAFKIGSLYVKSGTRRFRALIDTMIDRMGLTLEQAQPYARNAYNQIRDDMELAGEDVADMDSAEEVIREVRKMRAEASKKTESGAIMDEAPTSEAEDAGDAVRRDGAEALEGASPDDVPGDGEGRDAERGGAGSEPEGSGAGGRTDAEGDAEARGGRTRAPRGNSAATRKPVGEKKPKGGRKRARVSDTAADPDKVDEQGAETEKAKAGKVNIPAVNFTITDALRLGEGTEGQKYADNVAAIRLLKQIEGENRRATPDEQAILARYVGWGGLKNAFRVAGSGDGEGIAKGWEKRVSELEELLDPSEIKVARNSTKAAHYTSRTVVDAVWQGVQRLGFTGGAVLEPSVGAGNFLGLMPETLRGKSQVLAVEYDSITARIAKLLYPGHEVLHSGFEKAPLPDGRFALAIGNPPFGRDRLFFRYQPDVNGRTIHNQFFLASLKALAPDGLLAMVVTHNLMDALDPKNRVDMARLANLEAAIRLPSNAFMENARTEVVTDILFFRRWTEDQAEAADLAARSLGIDGAAILANDKLDPALVSKATSLRDTLARWVLSSKITDPAGSGAVISVNDYFMRNPRAVIGKIDASGTMNGRADLNVTMENPAEFGAKLKEAIAGIRERAPRDAVAERTSASFSRMAEAMRLAVAGAEPGGVRVDENDTLKTVVEMDTGDGRPLLTEIELTADTPFSPDYTYAGDGKWQIQEDVLDEKGKPVKVRKADGTLSTRNQKIIRTVDQADVPAASRWGKNRIAMLRDALPIRDLMKRQFVLEVQDGTEKQIERNREKLNAAYDAFVKAHGPLTKASTARMLLTMPDGALALGAEEIVDGKPRKAAIMSRRVTMPPAPITAAKDAAEAVAVSLSERGEIDLERVAQLLGTDQAGAEKALGEGENPRAFFDPETGRWEPADLYLSGLVRRKLNAAIAAGLDANIKALEAVQPPRWEAGDITPNLGSTWIPPQVYSDFLKHLGYNRSAVVFQSVSNLFGVQTDGNPASQWATSDRALSPAEIVERLLNSAPLKVTYRDSEGKTHVDEEATAESQIKGTEIFNEFLDWAFQSDDRREQLVDIFNEKFNTRLIRQRDGSHLQLPGKNPAIKMRRHQLNAIWRGITDRTVLYDHVVGAGKTFTAIARVMERRRMGLSRKPLIVVPNHLIEQWKSDFLQLYPGANVLAASKTDFEAKNRRRLFARIAAGDYDAVIIGHSSFGFINLDPSTEERYVEAELKAARDAVAEAEEAAEEAGFVTFGKRKPFGVAEAERLVTKLEERLAKIRARNRDKLISFEEMGIDDLTVDEAHEFKNLSYSSRLQGVSGMGNKTGSAKAIDLHLKSRSLHDRQGTSIAFLTGTPISNSVAEMYLVLRNLAPNELIEMGIDNFDAWRAMFVSYASAYEPTESGSVKEVTRLGREWMNMRSLMDLYYSVADAVPLDDIKKAFAEDNDGAPFPVPPVKSQKAGKGDREMVAVKPDAAQRAILKDIVSGFDSLPGIRNPKERNIERLKLMDRARKVSLDARAVDPSIRVEEGSGKIGAVVDNVARIWRDKDADRGTQVIFLDRSVPKAKGDEAFVAKYDEWVAKLDKARAEGDEAAEAKVVEELDKFDVQDVEARRNAVMGGWNAYDEIKRLLVKRGIPESEIRFVQEAEDDKAKKALFKQVRDGSVRVILGSTPRMGAGTNIQDRLVALHHVDVTWKPSDIEQREGRIVRQGNKLLEKYGHDGFEVEVLAYATEMTVDAKMWALNATKLKAINGIRKYDGSFNMEFEDEESANMAEMAALATGNPLMVERVTLQGDLNKLDVQRRSFNNRVNGLRAQLRQVDRTLDNADADAALVRGYLPVVEGAFAGVQEREAQRSITIEGKTFDSAQAAYDFGLEQIAEQRGEKEKARFKLDVEGLPVTSKEALEKEIRRKFGTEDFEMEIGGERIIDISDAVRKLDELLESEVRRQTANGADSAFIDGVAFKGLPMEIDIVTSPGDLGVRAAIDLNMVHEKQVVQFSQVWGTVGALRGPIWKGLDRLLEHFRPSVLRRRIANIEAGKEKAQRDKPELEAELAKPWAKAEEYEQKQTRLKEVIAELASASDASRLADMPETEVVDDLLPPDEGLDSRFGAEPVDPREITDEDLNRVEAEAAAELRKIGISRRVTAAAVRGLKSKGVFGHYRNGFIGLRVGAGDWRGTLDHEILHALRDPGNAGGAKYGLFTRDEWVGLVRAARKDADIVARVEKAYPDLNTAGRSEEMVAELYREWARGRRDMGALAAAFQKVKALFMALANALRGRGFQSAALTMERIAAGEIGGRGPQPRGPDGRWQSREAEADMRSPLRLGPAIIAGDLASATTHPDYAAAKAGDVAAAVRVARDLVTDDLVKRVREALGPHQPLVVPVVSEEAAGRNKIPLAAAGVLASRLGLNIAAEIVQANAPRRTALPGLDRIFAAPEFDGPVSAGQDYLVVDDTLTQGGTFASLAGHIEAGGGRVVSTVALTGKQYSAKLALSPETLQALRDKHGDIEPDFIRATGYGFDALTESEARYLARFKPPEAVRDRILAEGRRGGAGADQGNAQGLTGHEFRADLIRPRGAAAERGLISQILTDAMGGKGRANLLALVPGEPLLAELGKRLPSIRAYLNLKHDMGAERNERQARADEVAQRWRKAMRGKDGQKQNQVMMDLMHESTIARLDPSKPFVKPRRGPNEGASAYAARIVAGQEAHADLKAKFDALPEPLQSIYREVRDFYREMADAEERAVLENVRVAMSVNLQRAQRAYDDEMQRIRDDGLEGAEYDEAVDAAKRRLATVKRTAGWGASARISALRSVFESNRIEGPYFPLGRFGNYFVTVRDADGKVVSFSKFESEREQQAFAAEQKKTGARVQMGVMTDAAGKMKEMIDPTFVADIEKLVGDAGKDDALMDAIWQRYLETMPDLSIRKSRLHRKGTEGFARDAFRVFGVKAFHGAHQIARLRFGMKMTNELEKAEVDADKTDDPNRAKLVVNEILRRHEFTMNPKSSAWSAWASSAAFVYYLGATPAAAMVNLSQTTIVGVPVMLARFKEANVTGVTRELLRGLRDFASGKGHAADSKRLTHDEKRALAEAYRRGVIDKSQSHDLAGIAEAGAEYSDLRARLMKPIAFMFHHTERMNREITFLAAYRLGRAEGQSHEAAVETAGRVTWDTHFNYESDARPRLLQQDWLRVAFTFRNFQINMLYRLFRDMHQMVRGRTAEERKEARTQLIGITASMMLHAGITGTWGYALMTALLGLFDDDGADGVEEEIKQGLIGLFGPEIAGLFLKGVPGHLTGIDLTSRLGMPELWFRAPDRQMEGDDLYAYWVEQVIGPVPAIGASIFTGIGLAADGNVYRGVETAVPKFVRDAMKGFRYMTEGVTTRKGDTILEDVSPAQAITQALGFSPAKVSERYEINNRRMNAQKRIEDDRREILNEITKALRAGERPSREAFDQVAEFNRAHPQFAITGDTIRRSLRSRIKAGQDIAEGGGIRLNDKLEREIMARFGATSLYG
nr:PLxRFG domain-containing protein [Cereibacter sphaeroides f. sp. denitrificans]